MRYYIYALLILLSLSATACRGGDSTEAAAVEAEKEQHTMLYGIIADDYTTESGTIAQGETLGKILARYGVSAATVDRLDKAAKDVFPLRQIRAGRPYTALLAQDSTGRRLDYFVYEKDVVEYVVFGFQNDSITITQGQKDVTIRRQMRSSVIESSLWGAIMRDSLPYALAAEMDEIFPVVQNVQKN